jgi:hypothetical protein
LSAVREFGLEVEPVSQDASPEAEHVDAVTAQDVLDGVSEVDRQSYTERKHSIEALQSSIGYLKLGWEAWLVVISIPFTYMLQSFMSEAGRDAYKIVKRLLEKLRGIDPNAWLVLRDSATGTAIRIGSGLPDEAYKQLFSIAVPKPTSDNQPIELIWNGSHWTWATTIKLTTEITVRLPQFKDEGGPNWEIVGWEPVKRLIDAQVEYQWDSENHRWVLLSLPERETTFEVEVEDEDEGEA